MVPLPPILWLVLVVAQLAGAEPHAIAPAELSPERRVAYGNEEPWKRVRPRSRFIEAAVSDTDGETLRLHVAGPFASLDEPTMEGLGQADKATVIEVETSTLDTLLEGIDMNPRAQAAHDEPRGDETADATGCARHDDIGHYHRWQTPSASRVRRRPQTGCGTGA